MRLKYHIWHLLAAMTVVAVSLPLAKWLLALEAMDHPKKVQTTADFIGFYCASIAAIGLPVIFIVAWLKQRRERSTPATISKDVVE